MSVTIHQGILVGNLGANPEIYPLGQGHHHVTAQDLLNSTKRMRSGVIRLQETRNSTGIGDGDAK